MGIHSEVYEQLFSWLSKFSAITKHMNRRIFFSMICVLDKHNKEAIYSSYTHPTESYWVVPVLCVGAYGQNYPQFTFKLSFAKDLDMAGAR